MRASSRSRPEELRPLLEEEMSLLQDATFYDLRRVWLDSPPDRSARDRPGPVARRLASAAAQPEGIRP